MCEYEKLLRQDSCLSQASLLDQTFLLDSSKDLALIKQDSFLSALVNTGPDLLYSTNVLYNLDLAIQCHCHNIEKHRLSSLYLKQQMIIWNRTMPLTFELLLTSLFVYGWLRLFKILWFCQFISCHNYHYLTYIRHCKSCIAWNVTNVNQYNYTIK